MIILSELTYTLSQFSRTLLSSYYRPHDFHLHAKLYQIRANMMDETTTMTPQHTIHNNARTTTDADTDGRLYATIKSDLPPGV